MEFDKLDKTVVKRYNSVQTARMFLFGSIAVGLSALYFGFRNASFLALLVGMTLAYSSITFYYSQKNDKK